jgi:hypothetical protein
MDLSPARPSATQRDLSRPLSTLQDARRPAYPGDMDTTTPTLPTDAASLIEQLDTQAIRDRLAELDRQSRALRVLLRSALARQRAAPRHGPRPEACHVD